MGDERSSTSRSDELLADPRRTTRALAAAVLASTANPECRLQHSSPCSRTRRTTSCWRPPPGWRKLAFWAGAAGVETVLSHPPGSFASRPE